MANQVSDFYEFGGCTLDLQRRLLTRDGHPVPLQPKTFDLLLLMVRSPGRAFSKEELMKALWPDAFVEEANLSFQTSALRKALGDGGRWIETVPRYRYRFTAEVTVNSSADCQSTGVTGTALLGLTAKPSKMRWMLPLGFKGGPHAATLHTKCRPLASSPVVHPARSRRSSGLRSRRRVSPLTGSEVASPSRANREPWKIRASPGQDE
jgi:DNA-binding winged helix-turn-helix (wHTH) protein